MYPRVVVSGAREETAGEQLELTCTATVVDHLVVTPTFIWYGGGVGDIGVTENEATINENTVINTLTFSHLLTSHGGWYDCWVNINIPSINLSRSGVDITYVRVKSKCEETFDVCF